jgi:hypothetical protein
VHSLKKLSTFLEWAAKTSSRKEEIEHYLDDFLLAGRVGTKDCDFTRMWWLCFLTPHMASQNRLLKAQTDGIAFAQKLSNPTNC